MPIKRAIRIALKLGVAVIVGAYIGRHIPTSVRARLRFPVGMSISVALLCLFSVYWSVAAKDSAPTNNRPGGRPRLACDQQIIIHQSSPM